MADNEPEKRSTPESEQLSQLYAELDTDPKKKPSRKGRRQSRIDIVELMRALPGRFAMKELCFAAMVLILVGLLFWVAWKFQSSSEGVFKKYAETAKEIDRDR